VGGKVGVGGMGLVAVVRGLGRGGWGGVGWNSWSAQDDRQALADKLARKEERAILRATRRMEELTVIGKLHTPPQVGQAMVQIVWWGG
jgi:hypothetical protein